MKHNLRFGLVLGFKFVVLIHKRLMQVKCEYVHIVCCINRDRSPRDLYIMTLPATNMFILVTKIHIT